MLVKTQSGRSIFCKRFTLQENVGEGTVEITGVCGGNVELLGFYSDYSDAYSCFYRMMEWDKDEAFVLPN